MTKEMYEVVGSGLVAMIVLLAVGGFLISRRNASKKAEIDRLIAESDRDD